MTRCLPAPAAADDQRLALKLGMVAFFHRGVKGIAIHMRDAKIIEFWMLHKLRRAALRATVAQLKGKTAISA